MSLHYLRTHICTFVRDTILLVVESAPSLEEEEEEEELRRNCGEP